MAKCLQEFFRVYSQRTWHVFLNYCYETKYQEILKFPLKNSKTALTKCSDLVLKSKDH